MQSCRETHFNELSRAERGSRPRIYFEGNSLDNDASQGLLHLLGNGKEALGVDDRWAIVVISQRGETLETAVAFRQYLAALRQSCRSRPELVPELVVPITGIGGKLFEFSHAIGCKQIFHVPDGVDDRYSVLSAAGLLPASIMGLDILRLLEGAIKMNAHFRTAPSEENLVLDYVGISHLLETKRAAAIRVLQVWSKSLESTGHWYEHLLAESVNATPITKVRTLNSLDQQQLRVRRDKMFINLIVDRWRHNPLAVGLIEQDHDGLNDLATKLLPELMAAAVRSANQANRAFDLPTIDIHLPELEEATMGQLFQMLMLATTVEQRLKLYER